MWNSSIFDYFFICFNLPSTKYHSIGFILVNVPFVLPLCLYILHQGALQWRSGAKISHTDFFTYNMVAVHLIGITGFCLLTLNWAFHSELVVIIGMFMLSVTHGAILFLQAFTCLERYMAVVHPVTYLSLKSQTWILIRNISCGFVWLLCIGHSICYNITEDLTVFYALSCLGLSFCAVLVLSCNFCVLCVLIRPRPGDGAKGNKTKHKALYTITAIAGTLLIKFMGDTQAVLKVLLLNSDDNMDKSCAVYFSVNWFTLPSTLVLPMLYLQRKGKLLCFKTSKR